MADPLAEFKHYLDMLRLRASERQAWVNTGVPAARIAAHDRRTVTIRDGARYAAVACIDHAAAGEKIEA
jgi:hypothetical protein